MRRLRLGHSGRAERRIPGILSRLPSLQFVALFGNHPTSIAWAFLSEETRLALLSTFQRPSVTGVSLQLHLIGRDHQNLVVQCPKLQHLTISYHNPWWKFPVLAHNACPVQLKSLRVFFCDASPGIIFPRKAPNNVLDMSNLSLLALDLGDQALACSFSWFPELQQHCAGWQSLTTFAWHPTVLDMKEFGSSVSCPLRRLANLDTCRCRCWQFLSPRPTASIGTPPHQPS